MNQFLYKLRPLRPEMLSQGPTPQEASAVEAHFAYLSRLKDEGKVAMAGRTITEDQHTFGIVIVLAESQEEAQKLMEFDPAVSEGVMGAELFPFRVALWGNDPR
ncbi:YciI family protein [Ferrimonas sp.]|uniref:YciI family protein n=1 Tax=Ferrimonas sp. TaxID=2080861 RepID=UPI003A9476A8